MANGTGRWTNSSTSLPVDACCLFLISRYIHRTHLIWARACWSTPRPQKVLIKDNKSATFEHAKSRRCFRRVRGDVLQIACNELTVDMLQSIVKPLAFSLHVPSVPLAISVACLYLRVCTLAYWGQVGVPEYFWFFLILFVQLSMSMSHAVITCPTSGTCPWQPGYKISSLDLIPGVSPVAVGSLVQSTRPANAHRIYPTLRTEGLSHSAKLGWQCSCRLWACFVLPTSFNRNSGGVTFGRLLQVTIAGSLSWVVSHAWNSICVPCMCLRTRCNHAHNLGVSHCYPCGYTHSMSQSATGSFLPFEFFGFCCWGW